MTFQHAVLWMDHQHAVVIGLTPNLTQSKRVSNDRHHAHRDRASLGSRSEQYRTYFAAVAEAFGETPEILLLGPGRGHGDFLTWLQAHRPDQARHILKSIARDHMSDEELAEEGRRFFHAADRMLPQHPVGR